MVGDAPRGTVGGTYTLIAALPEPIGIDVGALGERRVPAGAYAYTGSALGSGGFSRVHRHRRTARGEHDVRHWHVDYLLGQPSARIDRVVHSPGIDAECAIASELPDGPIDGFGASDCSCSSHLSWLADPEGLIERVVRTHERAARTITTNGVEASEPSVDSESTTESAPTTGCSTDGEP